YGRPPAWVPTPQSRLPDKEQGVEHDCLSEGNSQDRLHQDFGGRAWIASDRIRSFHADETHPHGCAECGQTDMQVSAQLCEQRNKHLDFPFVTFRPALAIQHGLAAEGNLTLERPRSYLPHADTSAA